MRVLLLSIVLLTARVSAKKGKTTIKFDNGPLAQSEQTTEKSDLANRLYFQNIPRYDCYTRQRAPGRCIPLTECQSLRERASNYNSIYILQAVSDYICGFESAVKVCCPDRTPPGRPQQPIQGSWQNQNNGWQNQGWQNQGGGSQNQGWQNQGGGSQNQGWPSQNNGRPNQNAGNNRPSQPWNPRPTTEQNAWPEFTTERRPQPTSGSWGNQPSGGGSQPVIVTEEKEEEENDKQPQNLDNFFTDAPPTKKRPTQTQPPATNTPRPRPSGGSGGRDWENHKNRRLLPKDCGADVMAQRVLFGNDTALGEYPWLAMLQLRTQSGQKMFPTCGGSLISDKYIVTAAHCARVAQLRNIPHKIDLVRLGEHDVRKQPDCQGEGELRECADNVLNLDVEETIVHAGYSIDDRAQQNDIALLRLKAPVRFTRYVSPICLPVDDAANSDYEGESLWVAGWGRTSNDPNSGSSVMQKVALPVVPFSKCMPLYRSSEFNVQLVNTQMCAGGDKEDSCQGDSGGPLMSLDQIGLNFKWHLQGVVSFGPEQCGTIGKPGIYTKVTGHLKWILDNMRD